MKSLLALLTFGFTLVAFADCSIYVPRKQVFKAQGMQALGSVLEHQNKIVTYQMKSLDKELKKKKYKLKKTPEAAAYEVISYTTEDWFGFHSSWRSEIQIRDRATGHVYTFVGWDYDGFLCSADREDAFDSALEKIPHCASN